MTISIKKQLIHMALQQANRMTRLDASTSNAKKTHAINYGRMNCENQIDRYGGSIEELVFF